MTLGVWENAYNNPEKLGLTLVGEVSYNDDSYQFDMGATWWSPERRVFFFAEDSGCSCPSPFESYQDVESLGEPLDLAALTAKLRTLTGSEYSSPDEPIPVQVARIIERARQLVDEPTQPGATLTQVFGEPVPEDLRPLRFGPRRFLPGIQALWRFPNGYGASVVLGVGSYGVELAVVRWEGEEYEVTYGTPITEDVLGHLTPAELIATLRRIRDLG